MDWETIKEVRIPLKVGKILEADSDFQAFFDCREVENAVRFPLIDSEAEWDVEYHSTGGYVIEGKRRFLRRRLKIAFRFPTLNDLTKIFTASPKFLFGVQSPRDIYSCAYILSGQSVNCEFKEFQKRVVCFGYLCEKNGISIFDLSEIIQKIIEETFSDFKKTCFEKSDEKHFFDPISAFQRLLKFCSVSNCTIEHAYNNVPAKTIFRVCIADAFNSDSKNRLFRPDSIFSGKIVCQKAKAWWAKKYNDPELVKWFSALEEEREDLTHKFGVQNG